MPTLEELTAVIVVLYLMFIALFCLVMYLLYCYEKERERRAKQAFKAEVVDEVCAYFDQTRGDKN